MNLVGKSIVISFFLAFSGMTFADLIIPVDKQLSTLKDAKDLDKKIILDMVVKYTESVNKGDVQPELINDLWEHSPEVSNINIRGHQKGFEDIKKNFYEPIFLVLKDRNLHLTTTPRKPAVYFFDKTAVVEFYWLLNATVKDGNKPIKMAGRETHVYRNVHGQWKLVHLHYSGMPVKGF